MLITLSLVLATSFLAQSTVLAAPFSFNGATSLNRVNRRAPSLDGEVAQMFVNRANEPHVVEHTPLPPHPGEGRPSLRPAGPRDLNQALPAGTPDTTSKP